MKLNQRVGIIAPQRTPIGKIGGVLAEVEAWQLLATGIRSTLEKSNGVSPADFDDVIVGNVCNSIGNIARVAALEAGIPPEVPAITVDRQCASGMEALSIAASKINAGIASKILVGGTESATRAPWLFEKTAKPYNYAPPKPYKVRFSTEEIGDPPMGETAEILADEFSITREEMDIYATESHRCAGSAQENGAFDSEIIPVSIPQRTGDPILVSRDECVRPETSVEVLGKLRPAFRKDGRVTAGNSSPMNDGAASAIVASEKTLQEADVKPEAWLTGVATVGLDPNRMGLGPAIAIPALLEKTGKTIADIDIFEINEAFAVQVLAVNKKLNIPLEKLNINGGAIALGHPLGCSGLRIVTTLIYAMKKHGHKTGVASLCVGGGQGMAVLIEMEG